MIGGGSTNRNNILRQIMTDFWHVEDGNDDLGHNIKSRWISIFLKLRQNESNLLQARAMPGN